MIGISDFIIRGEFFNKNRANSSEKSTNSRDSESRGADVIREVTRGLRGIEADEPFIRGIFWDKSGFAGQI